MLITQYRASKIAGVSRQAINIMSKQSPRPGFFYDVVEAGQEKAKVDDNHSDFKRYCKNIEMKKNLSVEGIASNKTSDEDIMKIFDAVEKVIVEKYGEEEAGEVKRLIFEELEG